VSLTVEGGTGIEGLAVTFIPDHFDNGLLVERELCSSMHKAEFGGGVRLHCRHNRTTVEMLTPENRGITAGQPEIDALLRPSLPRSCCRVFDITGSQHEA